MENKIGKCEYHFFYFLQKYMDNEKISIGKYKCKWYFPDIVYADFDKNIFIDIEIDEPYSYLTGETIHTDEMDKDRDKKIVDFGWNIIRFSEKQVALYPERCCKKVAELIRYLTLNSNSYELLQGFDDIEFDMEWDEDMSIKLFKSKYRDTYLHTTRIFNPGKLPENDLERKYDKPITVNVAVNEDSFDLPCEIKIDMLTIEKMKKIVADTKVLHVRKEFRTNMVVVENVGEAEDVLGQGGGPNTNGRLKMRAIRFKAFNLIEVQNIDNKELLKNAIRAEKKGEVNKAHEYFNLYLYKTQFKFDLFSDSPYFNIIRKGDEFGLKAKIEIIDDRESVIVDKSSIILLEPPILEEP